jgi:hypothetical protein
VFEIRAGNRKHAMQEYFRERSNRGQYESFHKKGYALSKINL